jgi:hypothetical protein
MNRKLRRTTDAAMRGTSVIDRELDMWAAKYSSGGSVPRSVKLRVARLVEARKVAGTDGRREDRWIVLSYQ